VSDPASRLGRHLYRLLPEVYRTRDQDGELAALLDACGGVLDRIRATLDQQLADTSPATCQPWLIPYFAQLLDVRLVSPHLEGQRAEVAHGIEWRQRKGTLRCVEEIAEAVGGCEVEVQEGWKRIAVTPRVGAPLLPEAAFGGALVDRRIPRSAARHPGLPAITVDLRQISRAVQAGKAGPWVRETRYPTVKDKVAWRHIGLQGVPCFPGSYEDGSRRTADLRSPDQDRGHAHPRRLLLFYPPPDGFFSAGWERAKTTGRRRTALTGDSVLEDRIFPGRLTVSKGRLTLRRCVVEELVVRGSTGALPVLIAEDSLVGRVTVDSGLARIEHCTVLGKARTARLQASDSLFADSLELVKPVQDRDLDLVPNCVRYSRIPPGMITGGQEVKEYRNTREPALFMPARAAPPSHPGVAVFSQQGWGVLHPACPRSVIAGAEDGGEMGAYHHRMLALKLAAMRLKLEEFLPVGVVPVLIPDMRLLCPPPKLAKT
jgi:hypothetical protein